MDQHFLPEFYLKGFTDPQTPHWMEPYVWIYQEEDRSWKKRAPKNLAIEVDYYSSRDAAGNRRDGLEIALSQIEGAAARIIRDKIANAKPLDDGERLSFALFVGTMWARTPAQIEYIASVQEEVARRIAGLHYQRFLEDPRRVAVFLEEYNRANPSEPITANLRPEDFNPDNFKIRAKTAGTASITLSAAVEVAPLFLKKNWTFLVSEPPDFFHTSDSPFCMVDPTNKSEIYGPALFAENTEVSLPLTRHLCFFACGNGESVEWRKATRKTVRDINVERAARYARRFIAAPSTCFPGSDLLPPPA